MAPRRYDPAERLVIPFIVAILFHGLLAGGIFAAGEVLERDRPEPPIEFEVVEKPRPKATPKPPPPPPEPPAPEPPPKEVKADPKPVKRTRVARRVTRKVETKVPPPSSPEPPAPGENNNDDAPAPEYTLPDPGTQGGVPVAKGKRNTRRSGTGGTGTNTGGGGKKGTGPPAPKPVSVASIKVMPKLLGEPSYSPKDYPVEAKRRGIQGKVKVRIVVNQQGRVSSRRIVKSLGHGLDRWALRLARQLRFKPAIDTTGAKVNAQIVYTFTFVIPR